MYVTNDTSRVRLWFPLGFVGNKSISVCPGGEKRVVGTHRIFSSPRVSYQRDRARFFPPRGFAILLIFITFPSVESSTTHPAPPPHAVHGKQEEWNSFHFYILFLTGRRYARYCTKKHSELKRSLIIHLRDKPPRKLIYAYINDSPSPVIRPPQENSTIRNIFGIESVRPFRCLVLLVQFRKRRPVKNVLTSERITR